MVRPMDAFPIELLRHREHQLHAYCHLCDRWRVLNLDDMLSQWRGLEYAPAEVRCSECSGFGILKVRRRLARHVQPGSAAPAAFPLAG